MVLGEQKNEKQHEAYYGKLASKDRYSRSEKN